MTASGPDLERSPTERLFHLAEQVDWATAVDSDTDYRSASLDTEGFIHLSAGSQVPATTQRHYAGRDGLVLLSIDAAVIDGALLRWETAPHGEDFPHLYGPLPVSAVIDTHAWPTPPTR